MTITVAYQNSSKSGFTEFLLILLLILAAAAAFYVTPYEASNLRISPDSVEYAIGGNNIVTEGGYFIRINGQRFPPRYPPWFSAFFIAPAYFFLGEEIGNGIYPITLMAILGVFTAYLIGRYISGIWGGMFAGLGLILLPLYRIYATEIMTEAPCCTLLLLAALLYVHIRNSEIQRLYLFLAAGLIIAMASSIRPVSTSIIFPFLIEGISPGQKDRRITKMLLILIPVAIMTAANFLYNYRTFGSPLRNGYNYWCAVPFDFTSLCFSLNYLTMNIKTLLLTPIPALILVIALLFLLERRFKAPEAIALNCNSRLRHFMIFTVIAALPIITVHLVYFFDETRFYLPVTCLLIAIAAGMTGRWFGKIHVGYALTLQTLVTSTAAILACKSSGYSPPMRAIADQLANNTPANAIIISSLDPAYLDFFVTKSTQRQIIPLSRNVEYASKVACPVKVSNPQPFPKNCYDHRCKGLLAGGAKDIFPFTADEGIDTIKAENTRGRPICLEASLVTTNDAGIIRILENNFNVTARGGSLYQLTPKMTQ